VSETGKWVVIRTTPLKECDKQELHCYVKDAGTNQSEDTFRRSVDGTLVVVYVPLSAAFRRGLVAKTLGSTATAIAWLNNPDNGFVGGPDEGA